MSMRRKLFVSVMLAGVASPAFAQDASLPATETSSSNPSSPEAAGGLEEIVVTAQRREQRLQDVPVAVTALTAEALANRGITQIADITRAIPSLTITQAQSANNTSINIRGIGTSAFSIGAEPAVAVVVDDVALLQQGQAFSGVTDIARLEVLRGPQGTLFGKSASAGVVNIVSQAPTNSLSAALNTQLTTDRQFRIDGFISGPVADWAQIRVNAVHDGRRGYIRNLTNGKRLSGLESNGGRIRADLTPSSALKITLTGSYSKEESTTARTFRFVGPGAAIFGNNLLAPAIVGLQVGPDAETVRHNQTPRTTSEQTMFAGRIALDLDFATLLSITSYQDWNFGLITDADFTDLPISRGGATSLSGLVSQSKTHAHQFAQEFRLTSNGNGPLTYLLGLYYSNGHVDVSSVRSQPIPNSYLAESDPRSYAAFAQATYNITPTTHFDGGIRFNREEINGEYTDRLATQIASTCGITCVGNDSDEVVTYKVALRQDLSRDVMMYASYATGYKGQLFDLVPGFNPTRAANPILPEKSKAYEVGLKSTFWDRKIQLNLTGFWTDYRNYQAQASTIVDGVPIFALTNAGKLRSRGVEFDVSARPIPELRLDASASYLDAKFSEFRGAPCYINQTSAQGCVGGVQDLTGATLSNAPKFKYTLSARYEAELGPVPYKGFIQADWAHQSGVNFDVSRFPLAYQGSYGVFNGSVGLEKEGPVSYRLSLFVNNLFDQAYAGQIFAAQGLSAGMASQQVLPRDARRYFGLRAGIRY